MQLFSFRKTARPNASQSRAGVKEKGLLVAAAMLTAAVSRAHAAQLGDVFYIALENHNFTQPNTVTSPQQLEGNTAAPFLNSLITPGNPNAADVSYATNYTNAGTGEHPSEPNYVWEEAGTNFNPSSTVGTPTSTNQGTISGTTITNDNDSSAANGNIFTNVPHLTGQLNSVGVTWKNYQEDYQISGNGPTHSASGTLPAGQTNPYNGSNQYNYAEKHNPMAFFSDTATQNVYPISQLQTDLTNNTVGQYNWITPDQYNDMHSSLSTGFTYNGTHYTGDQSAVAAGDNFLSIVVPEIEASQAFKNNGAIVIWNDETEGGDAAGETSTEIVISPLAVGNAFASNVPMSHSSDVKTLEEVFQTGSYINNPIPTSEYSAAGPGTFNTVAGANDLSSLFQSGVIPTSVPEPSSVALLGIGAAVALRRKRRA